LFRDIPMQQVDLYTSEADAAYQGAPGAYSEEAARALLGAEALLMPCATLEQTFDAVSDMRAAHAVVPVEDAHSGTVPQIYDLLLGHDLVVSQEITINVDHVLVALPEVARRDIRRVLSHPIALAQCADFFRQNRGIEAVTVFDTAGAVRMIMETADKSTAAIASHRAAALYGAHILAEHIQDYRNNWTRFLLVSNRAHGERVEAPQKALIAFGLRNEPGSLVAALKPIAHYGLSITKIEGRPAPPPTGETPVPTRETPVPTRETPVPTRETPVPADTSVPVHGVPFEYRFIVEMTAAPDRAIPADVYDALRDVTTWFKPLGAFRV
jgi:prephenate dehydratase